MARKLIDGVLVGQVNSVEPNTAYRKCIRQDTSKAGKIKYLHVTRGWRERPLLAVDGLRAFWTVIARCQTAKA